MNAFDTPVINGTFQLTSSVEPPLSITELSVFRLQFNSGDEAITPFVAAKFCVISVDDIKVFAGVFIREDLSQITLIQIPLLGQSIKELVAVLNTYSDITAEVVQNNEFISSDLLEDTAFGDASGKWRNFEVSKIAKNAVYSSSALIRDLKFYLTSTEPLIVQKNLVQSLGGYVSLSTVYKEALLASPLSVSSKTLYLDGASATINDSIIDIQKSRYLQLQDEIVRVSKWEGYTAYLSDRNVFDTPLRFHPKSAIVREVIPNSFFDTSLSTEGKQYRCIAVKNNNATEIAKNLKVFFKYPSRNNLSDIRLAIECPKSDYYTGSVSSGGITAFTVSSLVGAFETDHFALAPISFTTGLNNGQNRIIKSYNPTSGTLELDKRLPSSIQTGDNFVIDTSPSQRVKSGLKAPSFSFCSDFFEAPSRETAISINIGNKRLSGTDLYPNEVVYIWIERSISESNDEFLNNRTALSLVYSRV